MISSIFCFKLCYFTVPESNWNRALRAKVSVSTPTNAHLLPHFEIRAWHVQSHPGRVGPNKIFWGVLAMGSTFELILRKNVRNFCFLNHPNEHVSPIFSKTAVQGTAVTITCQNQFYSSNTSNLVWNIKCEIFLSDSNITFTLTESWKYNQKRCS